MSLQAITWAQNKNLPSRDHRILLSLCNSSNAHHNVCLSYEQISERSGISIVDVVLALTDLIDRGFIELVLGEKSYYAIQVKN